MADIGIGALGYVGYAAETVEGTPVDSDTWLPVTSMNWDDSNDFASPLQVKQSRDMYLALASPYTVSGTMEMLGVAHDIGKLLVSAFSADGNVTTTPYVTSSFQHEILPGPSQTSFTMETSYTGAGGDETLIMQHSGVRVNTFEIRGVFGEPIIWSFGLDGIDRAKRPTGVATPTYDADSVYPFIFDSSSIDIGGGASTIVKEFTFGINNNIEHIGTIRSTRAYKRVALGARELTLSMSMDFEDEVEYDRFLDDDEFAVKLLMANGQILTGGTTEEMELDIDMPRVKYSTVGIPLQAGDFITQDVECTVLKPVGGDIATIDLFNEEDGAALIA